MLRGLARSGVLVGVLLGLAAPGVVGASRVAPPGSSECLDIPVSSQLVLPTSCRETGPTSLVVAGTDPRNPRDTKVVVVEEQRKRIVTLSGTGSAAITGVGGGRACISTEAGQFDVETGTGKVHDSCGSTSLATMNPAAVVTAASSPQPSSSLYVYGSYIDSCGPSATTGCPLYNDGATAPVPSTGGMTILDFGAPCFDPNTLAWGTQMFNSQSCTADSELVVLAQAWVRGYETNPARSTAAYVVAAGTSNSLTAAVPGYTLTPGQMTSHGQAWFQSLAHPLATATAGLGAPIAVWAGSDIEQASDGNWYDGPSSVAWVDGYSTAAGVNKPCVSTTAGLMVDYGDYVPNEPNWTAAQVFHVAYGAAAACPVPEIYFDANATNWQSLNQANPMVFTGVLSENGVGGSESAAQSWNSLQAHTGQSAPYLSVIGALSIPAAQPPDPPTGVTATAQNGSAAVSWTEPAWDGGAKISAYVITPYAGTASQPAMTITGSPPGVSATVTGLTNGTTYTFKVAAQNSAGTGPQSIASNPITPGLAGAPALVQAIAGDGEATITWNPPAASGASAIASYSVTASPGGATTIVSAVSPSAIVTGLTNGTAYTFTVAAINAAGTGPASAPSSAVTPTTVATGASAAVLPSLSHGAYGGYLTVAYVQNLGASPAHVRIRYVDATGNAVGAGNSAGALPHGATWTVRTDNGDSLGSGQAGSALVYSDQPVAVFVNEFAPGGGDATGYSGVGVGAATTIYAPTIVNNAYGGYTTGVGLVNTGAGPADITLTYRDSGGSIVKAQTLSAVPAGGYQSVYSGSAGLPAGFVGTATITTTGSSVAAVVNETGPGGQISSYDATPAGSTTLFAPVALNNAYGGYFTGMAIQNTTGTAGTVTITYYDSAGALAAATTHSISANGYVGVYQGTDLTVAGSYTARITSTVAAVATVNEVAPSSTSAKQSTAYNTFTSGAGALHLPLVESNGIDGWATGEGIMNTGAAATTVTVTYSDAATGAPIGTPQSVTLQPNAYLGLYQPAGGLPAGARASAVITTSPGGQVAVVCNESNATSFMSYTAQ